MNITESTLLQHTGNYQRLKLFLKVTGVIEAITGIGLVILPSFLISVLLGTPTTDPVALITGRLAGAALITISIACFISNGDSQSYIMIKAMLVYNILSTALLVYASLVVGISGPCLWPAVLVHTVLLAWSILLLKR